MLREAVRLFGESGFAGTSVRAVAAAAGVSPANVMHHFGSKDALRLATDERVLGVLSASLKAAAQAVVEGGDPGAVAELVGDPGVRGYLRRVLLDGGEAGRTLVVELVALVRAGLERAYAAQRVRPGTDLEYASVQVVALTVGPLLLGPLLPGFEAKTSPEEVACRAAADIAILHEGLLAPIGQPLTQAAPCVAVARSRSSRSASSTTCRRVMFTLWPAPGTTTSRQSGPRSAAIRRLCAAGVSRSQSPTSTVVGTCASTGRLSTSSWVRKAG